MDEFKENKPNAAVERDFDVLIRRPVLSTALGALAAAGAILLALAPGRENGRFEAGRRFLNEALARSELTRIIEVSAWFGVPDERPAGREEQLSGEIIPGHPGPVFPAKAGPEIFIREPRPRGGAAASAGLSADIPCIPDRTF